MDKLLYKNICESSAHRLSRENNAALIFENPKLFPELLDIALDVNDKFHYKACWILELVLENKLEWLLPYLPKFCNTLEQFNHNGALRSVSKIAMFLANQHLKNPFLSEKQLQQITESPLNWLISDEKVATKAYAIRTLFQMGKLQSWIYPELILILQQGFSEHSPAYKAVSKEILAKIKRATLP